MGQLYLFDGLDLENIFEEITSVRQLKEAFKAVRANKGAPGVDKQTIEEFEENLEEEIRRLSEELRNWTYKPQPVRRVEIPKEGGHRKIGIPCVRDRIVQQSIKISIEWKFEQGFSEMSFGFRPGRSQHQALKKAQEYILEGNEWYVDIDLEKFFDKIPQDRLMTKVSEKIGDKRVVRLIGITLRSGIQTTLGLEVSSEGTVQGSPLSPLLSNLYLDELDKELEKRGHKFCRFADDIRIFCKSKRAAERIMVSISKFIERRMKLKVNLKKSKVSKSQEMHFLGMVIKDGAIAISEKQLKKAMKKLKELIPRNSSKTIEELIEETNAWFRGWYEYVKITEYPAQISKIEAHIRRRLRAKIIKQKKRKRYLLKFLLKRKVKLVAAMRDVYRRGKIWAISKTWSLHQALPNKWFREKGLLNLSSNNLPHWRGLDEWIVLT